ncbi:hypothetical protein [Bacillus cereus]|uniref:hypothetical protein n=1 Tax=Bacillus cereus TaxID=1396 RepID=UPI001C54FE16|nr:hypothetical protein [Bacillus cereus]
MLKPKIRYLQEKCVILYAVLFLYAGNSVIKNWGVGEDDNSKIIRTNTVTVNIDKLCA